MDLEKLNKSYERAKISLEEKKNIIKEIEEELKELEENIVTGKALIIQGKRMNKPDDVKDGEDVIKEAQERIKEIKKEAEQEKEEMQMFQEKVDRVVEEIKENPEMKAHLEEVLAKRYAREIKKTDKEKEKEETKLEQYETLQTMMDEHPMIKNNMQGMLNANATINKLDAELSKLNVARDKNRIKQIQREIREASQKLDKNKTSILEYAKKKHIKITEETLKSIMENTIVNKKNNYVDVKTTMTHNISKSKKAIRGYEKQISHNEKAITKLGYVVPSRETEVGEAETGERNTQLVQVEDKPKPWQFIKRLKQWIQSKRAEGVAIPEQAEEPKEKGEFAQSLKYTVVQDIAKQMQKETSKEVKKEEKEQNTER